MAFFRVSRPFFDPFIEVQRMRREMERLMQGYFEGYPQLAGPTVFPPVNISEDNENVYLRAEVPGIKPAELEISVEGDTVTLSGERTGIEAGPKASYHRRELEHGSFSRALTLPARIVADRVNATAANGILTITLPKAEEAKPRQITIKAS